MSEDKSPPRGDAVIWQLIHWGGGLLGIVSVYRFFQTGQLSLSAGPAF